MASELPTVHFLIGLPGAGKTHFARRLQKRRRRARRVSSDEIRGRLYGSEAAQGDPGEVFRIALQMVERLLRDGREVIYDATNLERGHRRSTLASMRRWGAGKIIGYWIRTSPDVCLARNRQRSRVVPETVILRMARHVSRWPPKDDDGFDRLITVSAGARGSKRGTAALASRTPVAKRTRTRP